MPLLGIRPKEIMTSGHKDMRNWHFWPLQLCARPCSKHFPGSDTFNPCDSSEVNIAGSVVHFTVEAAQVK